LLITGIELHVCSWASSISPRDYPFPPLKRRPFGPFAVLAVSPVFVPTASTTREDPDNTRLYPSFGPFPRDPLVLARHKTPRLVGDGFLQTAFFLLVAPFFLTQLRPPVRTTDRIFSPSLQPNLSLTASTFVFLRGASFSETEHTFLHGPVQRPF